MLRISKLTDYATVLLAALSGPDSALQSAADLADRTGIGLPTVSKLLKELQRAGLVVSVRGARGGYQLARPAAAISAAEIIDAVEGPVALTECSSDGGQCGIEANCGVGHSWQRVNVAIRRWLEEIKLTQLMSGDATFQGPEFATPIKPAWRPLTRA
jgi:FeS assembly SUF system regulator